MHKLRQVKAMASNNTMQRLSPITSNGTSKQVVGKMNETLEKALIRIFKERGIRITKLTFEPLGNDLRWTIEAREE